MGPKGVYRVPVIFAKNREGRGVSRRKKPAGGELFDSPETLKQRLKKLREDVHTEYQKAEKNAERIDELAHKIAEVRTELDRLQGMVVA